MTIMIQTRHVITARTEKSNACLGNIFISYNPNERMWLWRYRGWGRFDPHEGYGNNKENVINTAKKRVTTGLGGGVVLDDIISFAKYKKSVQGEAKH